MTTSRGNDVFSDRLARLGAEHSQRAQQQTAQARAARGRTPEWVRNLVYPGSIVGACLVGILTVVLSRYVMFHINGAPDPNADPDMTMIVDGALAFGIAFVLRNALHMTDAIHLGAKTVGIWIALTTMHNAVHAFPATWSNAFSPEWVEQTIDMTEPRSFYFRGMSFLIDGGPAQEDTQEIRTGVMPSAKTEIKINRY